MGLFYNTYNEDVIIIRNLTKYKLYNNNGIMVLLLRINLLI